MSSIELNKIMAAVLLAGIIAMFTGIAARVLIPEAPHEVENAYVIDTGAAPAEATVEEVEVPAIGPLLASADPANGEGLSRACAACHSFEEGGANKVGPNLYGVVGAQVAHHDGFNYSSAMAELGETGAIWDFEALNHFLVAPRDFVPGTAMSYAGLKNDQDRADLIAWLRTLSGSPVDLPAAE